MSVRHQATLMDSHDADDDGELILCRYVYFHFFLSTTLLPRSTPLVLCLIQMFLSLLTPFIYSASPFSSSNGQSEEIAELSRFDEYVEALQGFVSDDGFGEMQSQFMAKYVHVFEEGEENKLEYMPIYQEWVRHLTSLARLRITIQLAGYEVGAAHHSVL